MSHSAHVAIVGTGYVGLTTGACLAHLGWVDYATAAAGVLGSNICDALIERGDAVVCVDTSEFTMLELAELVLHLTVSSSVVEFRALPTDDPKVRRSDITLARSRLGWEPSVVLRDGLRRRNNWCRANR